MIEEYVILIIERECKFEFYEAENGECYTPREWRNIIQEKINLLNKLFDNTYNMNQRKRKINK